MRKEKEFKLNRSSRYYRSFVSGIFIFFSAFFITAFVSSSLFPVSDSSAQEVSVENRATGYFVSVTAPSSTALDITPTPSGATAVSPASTVNVLTNAPGGYKLYLSANDVNLTNGNISQSFTPLTNTDLSSSDNTNKWGYSTTGLDNSWSGITTTQTNIASQSSANYPNGTNTSVYFGVNSNTNMPASTYSTTVTYTAIAEGIPEQYTMQGFTVEQCNNMSNGENIVLMDTRDGKNYRVTKLADGNCWMTENLALDGGRTLTPEDSNVTENHTLPPSITDGTPSVDTVSQIFSGNSTDVDNYGNKYGNHYNIMAATANTGTASIIGTIYESVCPKGWRMPDINSSSRSYANLFNAYGLPTTRETAYENIAIYQQAPLYFATASRYISGLSDAHGTYWSRTVQNDGAPVAFRFYPLLKETAPYSTISKNIGASVRCVFQGETIQNNMYMQDITTEMCSNLAESTSTADNRRTVIDGRDGKSYKISHLADGNCWMASNLALDGDRTLQPTDSNVSGNVTLPTNITDGTANTDTVIQIAPRLSGFDGNYYNWCAATVSGNCSNITAEQTNSICPKGWVLPSNSGNRSFSNLFGKYNLPESNTSGNYITAVESLPLYFGRPGRFDSTYYSSFGTSYLYAGSGGYYWSVMPNSFTKSYLFFYDHNGFYPNIS